MPSIRPQKRPSGCGQKQPHWPRPRTNDAGNSRSGPHRSRLMRRRGRGEPRPRAPSCWRAAARRLPLKRPGLLRRSRPPNRRSPRHTRKPGSSRLPKRNSPPKRPQLRKSGVSCWPRRTPLPLRFEIAPRSKPTRFVHPSRQCLPTRKASVQRSRLPRLKRPQCESTPMPRRNRSRPMPRNAPQHSPMTPRRRSWRLNGSLPRRHKSVVRLSRWLKRLGLRRSGLLLRRGRALRSWWLSVRRWWPSVRRWRGGVLSWSRFGVWWSLSVVRLSRWLRRLGLRRSGLLLRRGRALRSWWLSVRVGGRA